MIIEELYRTIRGEMIAFGGGLSRDESERPVPALPGWTVKDAYAHVTGLCGDILDGRMEGAGSPQWTARQVSARANDDLPSVCAEWEGRGPDLDQWLQEQGDQGTIFVGFDTWTHYQDVRAALAQRGERDAVQIDYLLARALDAFDGRFRDAGAPALRVITDRVDRDLGEGRTAATLRTTDYELLRTLFGRRSRSQMISGNWDCDPTPYLEHLHLFELPVADLID
ncbi:MAG TPA: maleylpyruvate isomerase N-terminal domain-containing protein [Acidimicrobiia bacterium]|nr:maleylpyruvate isomerase N-terminal domain-containing protein [Acidimicrobiia bacterium]